MKRVLSILLLSLMCFSCSKEESVDNSGEVIFGFFAGECFGDCAQIFKLDNGKLYKDDNQDVHFFVRDELSFSSDTLADKRSQITELTSIFSEVPASLRNTLEASFGCPDCTDQGGIYVEMLVDDQLYMWVFDTDLHTNPANLQSWIHRIWTILQSLMQF